MPNVRRLYTQFIPQHYQLTLDLEREKRAFSGTVTLSGEKLSNSNSLLLHAKNLEITSVTVSTEAASFTLSGDELTIKTAFKQGECVVTIAFRGRITDSMHGLYPCYFDIDGAKKELLATQFESHHAREVFPCIDEPEAKATFDLTLIAESGIETLSNMPVAKREAFDNGTQKTQFETTPRMSTYLLAFVIGELHKKTARTKHGVEVNVWATPAQAPETFDFALDIATRAIDFYDDYFGTPYPLPKADHVALPDFSSGAMENWGLITYRESNLLVTEADSQQTKEYVASVIAHELSHQWFGNLVTMRWWDNLWLNESFASIMEYVCLDALEPEWQVWDDVTLQESIPALRRDAIDGVQAVQTEVRHPDEISTLFDGAIVYAKGARLMRMLLEYVGADTFRAGLKAYFHHHAYGNTDADDLWNAMSKASGKAVAGLINTWITQPGYPLVTLTPNGLTQERFFIGDHQPSSALWPLPLFASNTSLPELFETQSMQLAIPKDTLLNTGGRAHFLTRYDSPTLARLREQAAHHELPPVERLRLLLEQSLLVEAQQLDAGTIIPLLQAYQNEAEQSVWSVVAAVAQGLRGFTEGTTTADARLRHFYAQLIRKPYKRLGWAATTDETAADAQLRTDILQLAVLSQDNDITNEATTIFHTMPLETIDASIRISVLQAVLALQKDDALFDELFATYIKTVTPALKQDLMYGLASATSLHAKETLYAALLQNDRIRPQDARLWIMLLLRTPENRYDTWQWLVRNWTWVDRTYGSDMSYDRFVQYCGNYLSTKRELDEFRAFFTDKKTVPGLTRSIAIAERQIAARVLLYEQQSENFITELERNYP